MPGEGSIYKDRSRRPDGSVRVRWAAQLSVGSRENRVRIRRYAPWHDNTRARAKLLLDEILAERRVADPRMTLGDYLPRWLARYGARARVGPSQAANGRGIVYRHLIPALQDVRLVEMRPSTVELVLARAVGLRLSPSTVRHVYNLLSVALEDAVNEGLIATNPAKRVPRPTVPKTNRPPWSLPEMRRFLAACRGDRYEALYVVAAMTGLRQGELLGLAWSDVDLDAATIRVAVQLQRREGVYVRVPLKADAAAHTVPIPALSVDALRAHRERQAVIPLDDGLVFVTESGRPVNGAVVTHGMARIAASAGLTPRDFHSLRRFRASVASVLGIDPKVTQGQLGHANIATTLGIYTYTDDAQARAAAALVDGALREAL